MMIYVIADDLTGASDTGVQLVKKGYSTVVYIATSDDSFNNFKKLQKKDVLVIDTETRELETEQAKNRVCNIIRSLEIGENSIIYKKIDSTLRGNTGVEIKSIMDLLKKDICIISPTFPAYNRITVGGYLIVGDQPLGTSEYYYDHYEPACASYIPSLLEQQTQMPVGLIELKDVIKGREAILEKVIYLYNKGIKIIVADATNNHHLEEILIGSSNFSGSVMYAGSAGLANFLFRIHQERKQEKYNTSEGNNPILVLIGSRNSVMNSQVDYLKKKTDTCELSLNPEEIIINKEGLLKELFSRAVSGLSKKLDIIVRSDPSYSGDKYTTGILEKYGLTFRELEVIIRDFLGQLSAKIIEKTDTKKIIITGGDTAVGFCQVLGINSLSIMEEVLPGIPLSKVEKCNDYNLMVITKAGGFGEEDTLFEMVNKLKRYNK